MNDATAPPQRLRYSFEIRCRAVAAILTGVGPGAAAQAVGANRATGYRWWARYLADGWAGLRERPFTPHRQPRRLSPAVEAEIRINGCWIKPAASLARRCSIPSRSRCRSSASRRHAANPRSLTRTSQAVVRLARAGWLPNRRCFGPAAHRMLIHRRR